MKEVHRSGRAQWRPPFSVYAASATSQRLNQVEFAPARPVAQRVLTEEVRLLDALGSETGHRLLPKLDPPRPPPKEE